MLGLNLLYPWIPRPAVSLLAHVAWGFGGLYQYRNRKISSLWSLTKMSLLIPQDWVVVDLAWRTSDSKCFQVPLHPKGDPNENCLVLPSYIP